MLPYEDHLSLPLLYHLNSEPWLNFQAYNNPSGPMEFKSLGATEDAVILPKPSTSPVLQLIAARQSCRTFDSRPLDLTQLSDLLHAGYGVTGMKDWPNGTRSFCRTVPSAGGLYPLELYVVCDHVSEVPAGIYHFNPLASSLELIVDNCLIAHILPDLMQQSYLDGAAALLFLTAVLPRTLKKYGPRGYRYVLLEAGHVAQNVCLRTEELGLRSLCVGGFTDTRINKLLKLDGQVEITVYGVALGFSPD